MNKYWYIEIEFRLAKNYKNELLNKRIYKYNTKIPKQSNKPNDPHH